MRGRGHRVVVVGGGFGGLYAASYLGRSELARRGATITLVDRKNYFTFTPLLAEVAAGTLGREHVTYPYRILASRYGFHFVQDAACELDVDGQILRTERAELPFDHLVLAVGAEPRYFGNDALRRHSLPITSVRDALAIRDRVIHCFESAKLSVDADEQRRLLTFVVAGAGPAGVEIASEVHHFATGVLRPYYAGTPPPRVLLVDGAERILRGFDPALARDGRSRLARRGIDVRLNTRILGATDRTVVTEGGEGTETIASRTLIWSAGTAPAAWVERLALPTDRGAIKVNRSLQVEGCETLFAVGDATILVDERTGQPYPRVAPIAISQGIRAAGNIENLALGREPEPYQAHHAGKIVSLGDGAALVDLLGFRLTGRLAWWIYRAAYLLKLVGTKNKVRVLATLALNRLFEPDMTAQDTALPLPPCDAPSTRDGGGGDAGGVS